MRRYKIKKRYDGEVIPLMRKFFDIVLVISFIGEMVFFPSSANFVGCLMEVIVWSIFRFFFLKRQIILEHPFSFLAFLSFFLARYIPLPATLLEGKPITYGFEVPFQTFFWETIIFIVASMAFYASIKGSIKQNNFLKNIMYKYHFFRTDAMTLWVMGGIGMVIKIQQLSVAGDVEFGDVDNKFLAGLVYLQYAPLIMLFPSLSHISFDSRRNKFVWLYTALLFITSFATNSRQSMIYPILTILLLFFLYLLKHKISPFRLFSPAKLVAVSMMIFFGLGFLSDISLAMLYNRSSRAEIDRAELFEQTIQTLQNDETMEGLRNVSLEENASVSSYLEGWDETYLSNFMLNRYGNIRVSDQTLYYAERIGFANEKMQVSFFSKVIAVFPLPVLNFLGIPFDKNDFLYSPGDMLYTLAGGSGTTLGGFRVTSLVADGLATFGYWCFPLIFILLFGAFKLLDCFVYYQDGRIIYSTLGLINVFGFLGMFRNSIGCIVIVTYIMRGFWQQCFTFWIVVFLIHLIPFRKNNK
ncbi:hypothetical protein PQ465_01125 [Sphingobacterium oryzagri]|uniref:O-antigen polysaccharide polymerase Wzy n=1 Tax=Sphingobacterium oryzagri TaxID=3025669 RepID=A0ABY7WH86_9SPHI|nr:hypothetical protein [Sphingobacterium sp. KACC 22765]WDF68991.1 hypothetical protein PQ465_01125 [Sphingobacterium sp. KACC 22765]